MRVWTGRRCVSAGAAMAILLALSGRPLAQRTVEPTNSAPNPYQTIENYLKLPDGRTWGSTSAVDIDRDGRSIWVGERCGANTCLNRATGGMSPLPSILKFDPSGKLVASFGAGMLVFPHGIHVDRDGNVWVTDGQDNAPAPPQVPQPAAPGHCRMEVRYCSYPDRKRSRSGKALTSSWCLPRLPHNPRQMD